MLEVVDGSRRRNGRVPDVAMVEGMAYGVQEVMGEWHRRSELKGLDGGEQIVSAIVENKKETSYRRFVHATRRLVDF